MKVLLTLLISLFSISSMAVGFKNGNDISITNLSGTVSYSCSDNRKAYTRYWNCQASEFSPGTHDYFVSDGAIDADKVTLTSTRADGTTKTKTTGFDGTTSKSRFNLVIRTLTQSPLLKLGANSVNFNFTKGKDLVGAGTFEANVAVTGSRECRHRFEFGDSDKCNSQAAGCDHYFWLENYCR